MTTILIIVAGVIVTALLAYAVVNFIPRKLHWIVSIILIALAAFLVYKINFEIQKPITFNKEKKVKYARVIENLKIIRDAEVAHKRVTGTYTADGDALIQFIDTAKFAITETKNVPKTIDLGGGITKEVEERVVDTVGYEDVRASFVGMDYKNMMQIPGTTEKFKIEVGEIEKIAGLKAAVFEVKVDKALILKGMDYNLVKQEKEAIGGEEIRGEYVSIGSLGEVSEDGTGHRFMIKEINKITKNSLDLNNLKENHLSIQLCLDGFSFCIQDIYSKEVKAFAQYDFVNDTSISPEKHLNYIEELFEKDTLLQQEYNSINVTHSNNLTTQVPKAFFDKNKLKEYLQYTVKVLKNDFITTDEIGNSEIMNVYIPFVNVNNFLIDRFGSFYFKHSSTVLIETLLNKYKNLEKDFLIVNVSFNNLEIVILKNQKLELYNSYSFKTKEDFIYYILFTAEQLEMNPEDFELVLLGDIEKESELYAILYQYIRKINFHENTEFPELLNDISSHTNFTLLNQF